MNHTVRVTVIVLWGGWIAYTCFKRAIYPLHDNSSWWHTESHAANKNPLVRALNVLCGILVLAIVISLALGR